MSPVLPLALLVVALAVPLDGCAALKPLWDSSWDVPADKRQAFAQDKFECMERSKQAGDVNEMQFRACMEGRGWEPR